MESVPVKVAMLVTDVINAELVLDSLPVDLVIAILLVLQTLTAIQMESVPVIVAMLVTNVINAKVDTTK